MVIFLDSKNVLALNFAVKCYSKSVLIKNNIFNWSDEFIYTNKYMLETSQPCEIDSCPTDIIATLLLCKLLYLS